MSTFLLYKHNSRAKKINFEISFEEFELLTSSRCFYCDVAPRNLRGHYLYNGIDRKDNRLGYVENNLVPCCWKCNHIKNNDVSFDDMIKLGQVLKDIRISKLVDPVPCGA